MIERSVTDSLDELRMLNRIDPDTLLTQSCFFASKTHSTQVTRRFTPFFVLGPEEKQA